MYSLRISLTQGRRAIPPYNQFELHPKALTEYHNLMKPQLQGVYAHSRTFGVRYFEEIVDLKELIYFRGEVECEPPQALTLTVELLFAEVKKVADFPKRLEPQQAAFEVLSCAEYSLDFPETFQYVYLPMTMDEAHFCLINCSVHYLMIEYRFPSHLPTTDKTQAVAHALFSKGKQLRKYIGATETDAVHVRLSSRLTATYDALRKYFLNLKARTVTRKSPRELQDTLPAFTDQFSRTTMCTTVDEEDSMNFSARIACHDPSEIASLLLLDLGGVSSQILQMWHKLGTLISNRPKHIRFMLQDQYRDMCKHVYATGLVKKVRRVPALEAFVSPHSGPAIKAAAKSARLQALANPPVRCWVPTLNPNRQPILVEEVTISRSNSHPVDLGEIVLPADSRGTHMFVFVHGFQACAQDLKQFKNYISKINPSGFFLMSAANESDTSSSIETLGLKLSAEVISYVNEYFEGGLPDKVSFVGHSLGGLIIRAALPYLSPLSSKMHTFLTLGTPHLGISKNPSRLVNAGVWVLQALNESVSIKQLNLADGRGTDTYLYRLSEEEGLQWFKYVVLVGSQFDKYVSHESARVELTHSSPSVIAQMAKNFLGFRETLHRISVDFKLNRKSFDSLIGRAAHIQFLEDKDFIETLIYNHVEFFC